MPAVGVKFLGAYIKLRKFADKSKQREKIPTSQHLILRPCKGCEKKFGCRNVKISARFSGNPRKNDEIRTQIATISIYCKFLWLDRVDFVLYLYIEIDGQDSLQGVRFIYIITELSDEPPF